MVAEQRYVSRELTHFVGRQRLKDQEGQYGILKAILTDGELRAGTLFPGSSEIRTNPKGKLSDATAVVPSTVCFCDIPIADFAIHMKRYGEFGLSFKKNFLANKGARPVFYIARNALAFHTFWVPEGGEDSPRRTDDQFDKFYESYGAAQGKLWDEVMKHHTGQSTATPPDAAIFQLNVSSFIDDSILAYLKFFDSTLPDDDPTNVYMEREWRVLKSVQFEITDVERIHLPRGYAGALRSDFSTYVGQVNFSVIG